MYVRLKLYPYNCVYCGMPCTGIDHFPPKSKKHIESPYYLEVPCCNECNSVLRETVQYDSEGLPPIIERAGAAKDAIFKRYGRLITFYTYTDWDDSEVVQLLARLSYPSTRELGSALGELGSALGACHGATGAYHGTASSLESTVTVGVATTMTDGHGRRPKLTANISVNKGAQASKIKIETMSPEERVRWITSCCTASSGKRYTRISDRQLMEHRRPVL